MSENGGAPEAEARKEPLRLGGMALRNGLLIHGPTSWAAAARAPDGSIEVASGPKPAFAQGRLGSVPGLRGPLRLAEGLAVVPIARWRLRSARLPLEDRRVILAALATAVASGLVRRWRKGSDSASGATLREGVVSVLGMAPAVMALRDHDLAAYHGVEHKAIGAYEAGSDDPASATKEHERCGSNLVVPMLVLSAAGQLLLERALERPGPLARAAVGVASASLAAEMFAWSERNSDTSAARAFHRPGYEIQRLIATKEPTPEQLEVGVAALREILRVEQEADGERAQGDPLPAT